MTQQYSKPKIAIVNGICVHHDAISHSVAGTIKAIQTLTGTVPRLYTYICDHTEVDHAIVSGPSDILNDSFFRSADYIVYHFGIYYDLFNTILATPSSAKRIVRFHNVTPKELVSSREAFIVDRSLRQQANLGVADAIWADSEFNRQTLIEYGIDSAKISVEPLFVDDAILDLNEHARKKTGLASTVELLFVGRFVSSKGVLDLVDAVHQVSRQTNIPFRLRMAGNTQFSDPAYLAEVKKEISMRNLSGVIEFLGRVDNQELARLYEEADIFVLPSYHEGFCVPLIEAFATKCIPLTYAAGNLESLSGGLGVVVETGNTRALGDALLGLVTHIARRDGTVVLNDFSWPQFQYDKIVAEHLHQFRYDNFARRTVDGLRRLTDTGKSVI